MIIFASTTTTNIIWKVNRVACLCGHSITRWNKRKMMSTSAIFGIETEDGIFELKPVSTTQQQQQQHLNKFTNKRYLEFHHSQSSNSHPVDQLVPLYNLSSGTQSSNVSVIKGFRISDTFQPALVLQTENLTTTSLDSSGNSVLSKTVFEQLDTGLLKIVSSDNSSSASFSGDFCLVKHQGQHPVFDEGSRFAPVYKTLDQAKDYLIKVLHIEFLVILSLDACKLTDS